MLDPHIDTIIARSMADLAAEPADPIIDRAVETIDDTLDEIVIGLPADTSSRIAHALRRRGLLRG